MYNTAFLSQTYYIFVIQCIQGPSSEVSLWGFAGSFAWQGRSAPPWNPFRGGSIFQKNDKNLYFLVTVWHQNAIMQMNLSQRKWKNTKSKQDQGFTSDEQKQKKIIQVNQKTKTTYIFQCFSHLSCPRLRRSDVDHASEPVAQRGKGRPGEAGGGKRVRKL